MKLENRHGPMNATLNTRPAVATDIAAVTDIYNHYILNSTATFEEQPLSPADMAQRVEDVGSQSFPWLVAESDDGIQGYAYATRWRTRAAYRFSAEVSVYVRPGSGSRGVGTLLYAELFPRLRERGINAIMGGITLPNPASVAFHEKCGMNKVAHFARVGYKFERWLDVGYWQLLLGESQS